MAEIWLRNGDVNSPSAVDDYNPFPVKTVENGPGPLELDTNRVAMTTTAAQIAPSREKSRTLTCLNVGAATVYIGPSGKSATTGFDLVAGASKTLTTRSAVFGITAAGTATIAYIDEYDV